jgi:hypothetical protein
MSFDRSERDALARLADVLIPGGSGLPSASEAEVAGQWLDQVLSARPDLRAALQDVLTKAAGRETSSAVAYLKAHDAAAFAALTEFAAGAYFLNPTVLRAIVYQGQEARPIDPHPDYLDDGLLQSVIDRGPIYRPTPTSCRQKSN